MLCIDIATAASTPSAAFVENRALSDPQSAGSNRLIVSGMPPLPRDKLRSECEVELRTFRGTVRVPSTSNKAMVRFVMTASDACFPADGKVTLYPDH